MEKLFFISVIVSVCCLCISFLFSKKVPTLIVRVVKIISELLLVSAFFIIFVNLLQLKKSMSYMGALILLLILIFIIVIEVNREVAKSNKKFIAILMAVPLALMLPLLSLYQHALEVEASRQTDINYEAIKETSENLVKRQVDNKVELYNDLMTPGQLFVNKDQKVTISGKTNPNGVIVLANKGTHFQEVVQADDHGYFYHQFSYDVTSQGSKIELFVNNCEVNRQGEVVLLSNHGDKQYEVLVDQSKEYAAGTYTVGKEMSPGDYVLTSPGEGSVTFEDGTTKVFENQLYVSLKDGESIATSNSKMVLVAEAKSLVFDLNQVGMLMVGRDIPAGKLSVAADLKDKDSYGKKYTKIISSRYSVGEELVEKELSVKKGECLYFYFSDLFKNNSQVKEASETMDSAVESEYSEESFSEEDMSTEDVVFTEETEVTEMMATESESDMTFESETISMSEPSVSESPIMVDTESMWVDSQDSSSVIQTETVPTETVQTETWPLDQPSYQGE